MPSGYNNHDHGNAKNVKGDPASGPNRPDQTNATADIHISPDGRFLKLGCRFDSYFISSFLGSFAPASAAFAAFPRVTATISSERRTIRDTRKKIWRESKAARPSSLLFVSSFYILSFAFRHSPLVRLVGSLYRCCSSRYGSNRGHDSLVCFSIARDGLLKLVGFTYTGGRKHLCNCDLSMPLQSFTAVSTFSFSFRHPWIAAALLALHRGAPSELQHSSIWKLDLGGQPGDLIVSLIPLCLLYIYIYIFCFIFSLYLWTQEKQTQGISGKSMDRQVFSEREWRVAYLLRTATTWWFFDGTDARGSLKILAKEWTWRQPGR